MFCIIPNFQLYPEIFLKDENNGLSTTSTNLVASYFVEDLSGEFLEPYILMN